jgi:hypothetical protein
MNGRRDSGIALALATLAAAIYLPAVRIGFYSDDYQWLGRMSPTLERPGYVFSVFFRDFNPVLHLSFLVDWCVGGAAGSVWHAHSIVIHALCVALVFLLCRRVGAGTWLAAAATSMWACNVRISEAVIWPAARGHSLATLFSLAAIVALLSRFRARRILAVSLFAVALMTKETALFPLLLVPLFLPDWKTEKPLLGVLAGIAVSFVLFNVIAKESFHTTDADLWTQVLKIPFVLLRPLGLGDAYGFNLAGVIVVIAAFSTAAWFLRRTVGLAGLAWVVLCAAPIVPLDKLSSRYLYLISVGWALVLCGSWTWLTARLGDTRARRLATSGLAVLVVVVVVANVIDIQREIEDYRLLGKPYADCVETLREPLRSLKPGETAVLIDVSPRDAIRGLHDSIWQRGNMTKLIPFRVEAVGGLIELPDLLNLVRDRSPGLLGSAVEPSTDTPRRWFVYDGESVRELPGPPSAPLPPEVVFGARWGDADQYFGERH